MSMLASVSPGIAKPPGEKILFEGTAHKKFCGNYLFLFIHWGIVWNYLRILNLTVFLKWKMSKMDCWVQIALFQESMVRRILMMYKKNKKRLRAVGQPCSQREAGVLTSVLGTHEPPHSDDEENHRTASYRRQLDAVLRGKKEFDLPNDWTLWPAYLTQHLKSLKVAMN